MSKRSAGCVTALLVVCITVTGCKKKTPPPPPPQAPAPAKQTPAPTPAPRAPRIVYFRAEPSTIDRGRSATLRWSITDATEALIDPAIGTVPMDSSRQVYPSVTTTYTLRVKGPGGSASEMTRVLVTVTQAPAPPPPVTKSSFTERLAAEIQDIYFDYDKSDLRDLSRSQLAAVAAAMKRIFVDFPGAIVVIEGHCDERGSAEYNMALGDRRALAAREFLTQLGVESGRLNQVSFGKERPQCTETNEGCWQKNRRVHFAPGK